MNDIIYVLPLGLILIIPGVKSFAIVSMALGIYN